MKKEKWLYYLLIRIKMPLMKTYPSQESLKEYFLYDETTGSMVWRKTRKRMIRGTLVGSVKKGIRTVKFMNSKFMYSHIAWALIYGEWPKERIFHVNGDHSDFRASNLSYRIIPSPLSSEEREEFIRNGLSYDPLTGEIKRMTDGSQKRADLISKSYRTVSFNSKTYLAHRLAWFLHYGHWPSEGIDHQNHDGCDNRIENLRDVPQAVNLRNSKRSKANSSGCTGVSKGYKGRFYAWIGFKGKRVALGGFSTFEDAVAARKEAEARYGYHPNHGIPE
jgi:hypothetical protein